MVNDAEVAHEKENTMEYALVGEIEHRSDGAQEHRVEVYLDYALDTGNPVSEHSSDGEVVTIPNTFKEAMESPHVTKWKEATNKEMVSLQKHAVFNLVSPDSVPSEHKVIRTKWVFKVKADRTLKRRVAVQGWGQVSGIDCGFTFLPACRIQSICMALAIAASEDWEVLQLDVQTAFLNAEVQEEVYVRTPPGYESLDATTRRPKVMKLKKSLYGLRRSPRNWFNTIDNSLRDMGFTATASDPCVYTFGSDDNLSILTMHVDNLLLRDTLLLKDFKSQLMGRFAMTDMGDVSMVLGMQLTRDREANTLTISQEHYARSVPARFGMAKYNLVHTTEQERSFFFFSSSRTRCC